MKEISIKKILFFVVILCICAAFGIFSTRNALTFFSKSNNQAGYLSAVHLGEVERQSRSLGRFVQPAEMKIKDARFSLPATRCQKETGTTNSKWHAGFSRRLLDVKTPLRMGGYGFFGGFPQAGRFSSGIADELSVSTVAIVGENGVSVVFASLDVVGLSLASTERIREQFEDLLRTNHQLPACFYLVVTSTHTHSSPDTLGLWGAFPYSSGRDDDFLQTLETQTAEASFEAYMNRQPAEILITQGHFKNNSTAKEFSDDEFYSLRFVSEKKELGTLIRWSGHPSVIGMENTLLSSDFVGSFRKESEKNTGGISVFLNGSLGKVYPSERTKSPLLSQSEFEHEEAQYIGTSLAQAVHAAQGGATQIPPKSVSWVKVRAPFPISNRIFQLATKFDIIERPLPFRRNAIALDCNFNIGPLDERPYCLTTSEVGVVTIGDFSVFLLPGEIFPSVSKSVLSEFPTSKWKTTVSMANDWLGYIPSSEEFCSSFFAVDMPAECRDTLVTLGKGIPYHTALAPSAQLANELQSLTRRAYDLLDLQAD